MSLVMGTDILIQFSIAQTELLAGTINDHVAPEDGFLEELGLIVDTATGNAIGTVKAQVNTVDVLSMSLSVPASSAKGYRPAVVQPRLVSEAARQSPTRKVKKGDRISLVPAGFTTSGSVRGYLRFRTTGAQTS